MKKLLLTFLNCNLLILVNITHAEEFIDRVEVISHSPVVEKLYAPARNCYHSAYNTVNGGPANDWERDPQAAIIGALLGAAVGSNIGKGRGKDAATAIGAILGVKAATGGSFTGEEILGALAGGVIGNQIGKGSGRTIATSVGVLAGSAIANGLVSRNRRDISRECGSKVITRNVVTSYNFDYEYNGYIFTGNLPYRPSRTVDVIVSIEILTEENKIS